MPPYTAVLASNAKNAPKGIRPVAVLVGGTSGVGRGVAEVLGKYTQGNAHLILVGRNKAAADEIFATLPKPVGDAKYEFVACDASSMRSVGAVARELSARLDKINYLVLSTGLLSLNGRTATEDGVDYKIALHYYARFKFTKDLMPLIEKAAEAGEPARVLSMLDGTKGKATVPFPDDLTLEKNYSISNAANVAITYSDASMIAFAKRHPKVSFTHALPGLVNTNGHRNLPIGIRQFAGIIGGVFGTSVAECGEYMSSLLFSPSNATGAHFATDKADPVKNKGQLSDADVELIWKHSLDVCDGK